MKNQTRGGGGGGVADGVGGPGGGGGEDGEQDGQAGGVQHAGCARASSGGGDRVVAVGTEAPRSCCGEGGSKHDPARMPDDTAGLRDAHAEDPIRAFRIVLQFVKRLVSPPTRMTTHTI